MSKKRYAKGDRIIINAGTHKKPEYYCVTVTAVRQNKWYIRYDDGDKGDIDDISDIVGLANNKLRKTSFGRAMLDKFLLEGTRPKKVRVHKPTNPMYAKVSETEVIKYFVDNTESAIDSRGLPSGKLDFNTFNKILREFRTKRIKVFAGSNPNGFFKVILTGDDKYTRLIISMDDYHWHLEE